MFHIDFVLYHVPTPEKRKKEKKAYYVLQLMF